MIMSVFFQTRIHLSLFVIPQMNQYLFYQEFLQKSKLSVRYPHLFDMQCSLE